MFLFDGCIAYCFKLLCAVAICCCLTDSGYILLDSTKLEEQVIVIFVFRILLFLMVVHEVKWNNLIKSTFLFFLNILHFTLINLLLQSGLESKCFQILNL